jgi:hypothetical protein
VLVFGVVRFGVRGPKTIDRRSTAAPVCFRGVSQVLRTGQQAPIVFVT